MNITKQQQEIIKMAKEFPFLFPDQDFGKTKTKKVTND